MPRVSMAGEGFALKSYAGIGGSATQPVLHLSVWGWGRYQATLAKRHLAV
jgi:hypothetical protein